MIALRCVNLCRSLYRVKSEKKKENPLERIWYGSTKQMVGLTPRELEIVYWVGHGLRNAEISEMMNGKPLPRGIESVRTVCG